MTDLSFPSGTPPPRRRRKALSIVLLLLGLCSLVTLLAMAAYLALSRTTRTYTDAQFGFSVPYPALWSYGVERSDSSYRVVFTPELDPLAREQRLSVAASKDAAYARLSHNQCLMWLKTEVAGMPSGELVEIGRRTVAGWEGAVAGFRADDPRSLAGDAWLAMLSTNDGALWLGLGGPKGSLEKLRAPFERLLAGLTLTQQGQADNPAEELAACAEGFYPYRAACAELGFCYPASWLAYEAPSEVQSGSCDLLVHPLEWNDYSGVIYLSIAPTAAADRAAPDERLLSDLRQLVADDQGTVTIEPVLTRLAGRRAAVITWQTDIETYGVTSTVGKRGARILDDEWDLLIVAAGPLTARQLVLVEFDRLVASLVLRSPTVRLRQ